MRLACGLGGLAVAVRWSGCGPCVCWGMGAGDGLPLVCRAYGLRCAAACFVCVRV
ncbi:MAG: hypothetical protein J6J43_09390 [Oscillospiraceae bacterium]|nr:hypothetical protein [Oscillospiraceae bacterium]